MEIYFQILLFKKDGHVMDFETLPKRVIVLWEVVAVLIGGLFIALTIFIFVAHTIVWYILLWLFGAIIVLVCFLYLPLLFMSTKFKITEEHFILHRGVIFYKSHYMKRDKISYISVYKNPFTGLIDISSLILTSPGAQLIIPFMGHERAVDIAKLLSLENRFEEI